MDGTKLASPARTVTAANVVTVDGEPLPAPPPPRLWRYHKPAVLLTTHRDPRGRPTVFASLPKSLPRVVSVGRLDFDSEGLLLLTTSGALSRRLESPGLGWKRRYRVRVHGRPDEALVQKLARGVTVDGTRFGTIEAAVDRQQGANAWLTVSLAEGRNREVRRAFGHVGLAVNRLIRIAYGPFQLGKLEPGAVDEVPAKVLREQLGASP